MKKIDIHMHVPPDDPLFDNYLKIMDRHEVEAALVHGSLFPGQDNEEVLRAVKAHPDRLYGSVHVDLRRPVRECIRLVRRYANEGFRSIKLFPNLGFDPNDEKFEPFWEALEKQGLLCFSHCGWLTDKGPCARQRLRSELATPFHFEVPARRFPKLRFIFAHFGGAAAYLETITLTLRLPNCFADTCPGWGQFIFAHRLPGLEALDFRKILYGTDGAGEAYSQQEYWWRETILSLGKTPEDFRRYMYDNAAELLGIASSTKEQGASR